MLNNSIYNIPPFYTEFGDSSVFNKIVSGNDIGGDKVINAVMIALFIARTDKSFSIVKRPQQESIQRHIAPSGFMERCFRVRTKPDENRLLLCEVASGSIKEIMDALEPYYKENLGAKRLAAKEEWIKSASGKEVGIFVFEESNSAVIFYKNISYAALHLIASFIPTYFPSIFKEQPVTEEEKEMLFSLTGDAEDKFMASIMKLAEKPEIKNLYYELLNGFEQANVIKQKAEAENRVHRIEDEMEDLMSRFNSLLQNKQESLIMLLGLETMIAKGKSDDELKQYFMAHNNVHLLNVEGGRMDFMVTVLLDTYDAAGYAHLAETGTIYNGITGMTRDKVKLLMDSIFSEDPVFQIKTSAIFTLEGVQGRTRSNDRTIRLMEPDYIPNPHLDFHACLGQNKPLIDQKVACGDYMGAIECCIAAAASVNVHETGVTFKPFMNNVMNSKRRILRNMETGEDMTPQEAIKYLENKQKTEETEGEQA